MKHLWTLRTALMTALLGVPLLAAAQDENPNAKKAASTTPPDMTRVVYGSDQKFNVLDLC
jgi:hypothetical protein